MAAVVLEFGRRGGKSALMWHHLARESKATGRAIVCVDCLRPHPEPPQWGKCGCGSYTFKVRAAPLEAVQQLELDVHAGEQ